jgi:hypothetical protein
MWKTIKKIRQIITKIENSPVNDGFGNFYRPFCDCGERITIVRLGAAMCLKCDKVIHPI